MRPTLDPFAPLPSEEAADEMDLYELAEARALTDLRVRGRLAPHLARLPEGHLVRGRGFPRRSRRRLAIRSPRVGVGAPGHYIVLRRGAAVVVRLPFA